MNNSQEQKLFDRARAGGDGFGELFDAYYDRIYAFAYRRVGARAVAEDIAACTFEDALRGIRRMHWQGKPVSAWLYRIASRRVVDHYRRAKNEPVAEVAETQPGAASPSEMVEASETAAAVREALARLNPRDREIIQFVYFDGLETEEIAAIWECTANSVYVRLHRALKRLRTVLEGDHDGME